MSELDHLTTPLTSHVHSAEMHNQSVNSMALVSARATRTALQLLQVSTCSAVVEIVASPSLIINSVLHIMTLILDLHYFHCPRINLANCEYRLRSICDCVILSVCVESAVYRPNTRERVK